MRKLLWESNPKIGFWINNDPIKLYYGTPFNPDIIAKIGIIAPTKRWVSMNIDPYTAQEKIGDGFVIVTEIPMNWLFPRMDQRLGDNTNAEKERLLRKELYDKWSREDWRYYLNTEIHVVNSVPSRYIVGFMQQ